MDIEKDFARPSVQYRGKPFWAWNGKLEEEELRRQVRILRKMGFAGGFMHSRVGLDTEYLSDEWFKMINACVDEAKKTSGEMWLYDEDRWPSGAAGGIVTKNPRYRQRRLTAYLLNRKDSRLLNKGIRTYYVRIKDYVIEDISASLSKNIREKKGYKFLTFIPEIAECSSWYNGYTYLDTLSEDAVEQFIKVTFEAYKKHCGKEFGKTIPGIFTDEPNHGTVCAVLQSDQNTLKVGIPWTDKFAQIFRERFGYEIEDHLPELFFDIRGQKEYTARYHYHLLKTKLFVESFAKLIGNWCKKNSLLFTGHVLEEESLMSQTSYVGAAMRFYEYMQAPGIDILTADNWEYETVKQCSSVANQMAKKWVLSELYGCTGWGFTFEGHKMVGDWQAAMGINLRAQHLSWYTMKQQAKRDYPASIFYQSPWWQEYRKVEDYFSRVNVITTQGKPVKNLLVIHSIESMWMKYRTNCRDSKDAQFLENSLPAIRKWLLENNIDFDYGDEELIAKYAEVKKAKEPVFKVGKMEYKTVLVPPMTTIRKTTLGLLKKFIDAGGKLFFVEPVAQFVDGKQSSELSPPPQSSPSRGEEIGGGIIGNRKIKFSQKAILDAVSQTAKIISIKDKQGNEIKTTNFMLREDESVYYLFMCNTGKKEYNPLSIHLSFAGYAEEWNPLTGKRYVANFKKDAKGITVNTKLYAYGSTVIVVKKNKPENLPQVEPLKRASKKIRFKKSSYPIILSEPNVVVLDMPDAYRINDKKYSHKKEILKVDNDAREFLGVPLRGGQMCQPWTRKKVANPISIPVELRYKFDCDFIPGGLIELAVESPEKYTIFINKYELDIDAKSGWWVDKSIQKIPVNPQLLNKGENEILLKIDYTEDDGLENLFLLGNFAVDLVDGIRPVIKKTVDELKKGNWVKQGLPFYSGSVLYHADLNITSVPEKAVLQLPDFKGVCFKVKVNGEDCGTVLWQPYELNITDALTPGKNSVSIEIFSSRRNSFGPLHQAEPEKIWTGPSEFVTTGKRWTQQYNLKPYGLMSEPLIEVYG